MGAGKRQEALEREREGGERRSLGGIGRGEEAFRGG